MLGRGATLAAYTAGVTDAVGADGAACSEPRLLSRLASASARAGDSMMAVRTDLEAAMGNAAQFDDIILLVLHRVD